MYFWINKVVFVIFLKFNELGFLIVLVIYFGKIYWYVEIFSMKIFFSF